MERTKFLELCQKSAIGEAVEVEYNGSTFKPHGYELTFDSNGKARHTAILLDKTGISILRCRLELVSELVVELVAEFEKH